MEFIGGVAGSLSSGYLLDRTSATTVAPIYYIGLAISLLLPGWLSSAALIQTGGQAILNTLMSQLYPTHARATGIGWAGGCGRIGGVVLPLFGGVALEYHYSIGTTMTSIAAIPIGVVVAILLLRTLTARVPIKNLL